MAARTNTKFSSGSWKPSGRENLVTDDPPIVAVNANSGNPHYEPHAETFSAHSRRRFRAARCLGEEEHARAPSTTTSPGRASSARRLRPHAGNLQRRARRARRRRQDRAGGIARGQSRSRDGKWTTRCASYIKKAGFGEYFIHRTGHSIGTEVHGNGANMDDLETHDERRILPNSCFSIEPGIYLPEFGVRSEVNMLVRPKAAEVTGKIQREIVII